MNLPGRDRETSARGLSSARVQWKNVEACLDVHCVCGNQTHVDTMNELYLRCADCKRTYWIGAWVQLVELTAEEVAEVEREGYGIPEDKETP